MRIVIDTNVVASAVFFGGRPGELLELVLHRRVEAVATDRILAEYQATIDYLLERHGGEHLRISAMPIFAAMEVIPQTDGITVCRDPDDDKFISCAVDGKCIYIVSGDKDLLSLGRHENVEIVTVAQFLDRFSTSNPSS
ncbi:MAG: putative toxin-antitoxin system toxin component, PIN family [Victivallales bacterium]|nr:putative toxin-antitoxin system toxin component, PIN family [Victivallales bacterium]